MEVDTAKIPEQNKADLSAVENKEDLSAFENEEDLSAFEEEKINPDEENKEDKEEEIVIDKSLIPTNLFMITPDLYFTLPNLDKTLELLTKRYYKKNCSLCKKITKRGAICLVCEDYICVTSCTLDIDRQFNPANYTGNLTKHSRK
mmetsp:Transcript_3959/g.3314  ORF Transcript_3959/g.3314 Transcript_3959/m.3314 type:complete len:146 (+) Transcript_3959:456-893(+)